MIRAHEIAEQDKRIAWENYGWKEGAKPDTTLAEPVDHVEQREMFDCV